MRGVPSLMRPRMTSSLPPAVSFDNRGPKVRALICGGRWQIPQDWAKTCRPNFCVAVNPSSVAACCANAPPAASAPKRSTPEKTAERTAERFAAPRFILNPPDIFFCKPTPAQCQAEGLDPEPGGLTGMRSGGGVSDDLRMDHARHGEAERGADTAIPKGRVVDRACAGDWRGYAVDHSSRRRSGVGAQNNHSRRG